MPDLTPAQFVAKWKRAELSERAASQEHFIDLCNLLGQPTPAGHDATGAEYTFEKGIAISGSESDGEAGGRGFADAWWRGKFAWEYKRKGKHADLTAAYKQLSRYREALENPPLLIVSDIARTEIHTNFTGTVKQVHTVTLDDIADGKGISLLRRVFTDPRSFKPTITPEKVTAEVAKQFGTLAESLRKRRHDPHDAAHFLMKCMFCLFAEDVELLPSKLFKRTLEQWHTQPAKLTDILTGLFAAMRTGGAFGPDPIGWFNGGLFDESSALELTQDDIGVLILAAKQNWASVEPAIFGTLFERSLDPSKRAQIGAHYTSRDDIMLVVEPVIMAPLRQQWETVRAEVESQLERRRKATTKETRRKADQSIAEALRDFMQHLASLRILDPACGSGNFLYVAIQQLLDLEKEVITFGARPDLAVPLLPGVRPTQLHGIEINPYAAELAQVVIWIGYLQWMRDNGFNPPRDPILAPLQTIECRDAILDLSDPKHPKPATWPDADFIIGNPPFAGRGMKRRLLTKAFGPTYVDTLNATYAGHLRAGADLCCYWLELARRAVAVGESVRVGLLATQGIRGGTNREVLDAIKKDGNIFAAVSDRPWALDGAMVHISIICFDDGTEQSHLLDGVSVDSINSDLTTGANTADVRVLPENAGIGFQGVIPMGPFELPTEIAIAALTSSGNPNGRSNCEVIRRWANGADILDSRDVSFIVDFNDMDESEASGFAAPFQYVQQNVLPARQKGDTPEAIAIYWLLWRRRPALRRAITTNCDARYIATPRVSKHRVFVWVQRDTLPSDATVAIARDDDYTFGVLESAIHYLWSILNGTQLREQESGKRYSHTMTFNTFPFPWPLNSGESKSVAYRRIAEAARQLSEQRERWLNPPEWINAIAQAVDDSTRLASVPATARPLVRESIIMARAANEPRFKKRTVTALYNERPTWLKLAQENLDRAVLAAYAEVDPAGGWAEDWAEVWRDTGAGQSLPTDHPLAKKRAEVDQRVLLNLLRLNHERAGAPEPAKPRARQPRLPKP